MPVEDGASTPDVAVGGSSGLRVGCQCVSALNPNHMVQGQGPPRCSVFRTKGSAGIGVRGRSRCLVVTRSSGRRQPSCRSRLPARSIRSLRMLRPALRLRSGRAARIGSDTLAPLPASGASGAAY